MQNGTASELILSVFEQDDFLRRFGLRKTRYNCQLLQAHYMVPNCSMATMAGVPSVDGLRSCTPGDILDQRPDVAVLDEEHAAMLMSTGCPYECTKKTFFTHVSDGDFDLQVGLGRISQSLHLYTDVNSF